MWQALIRQLNDQITKGDILGAFDKFYAENVTMQENARMRPPRAKLQIASAKRSSWPR